MRAVLACLLALLGAPAAAAAALVFDLRSDWSETSNPNGAWAYREGTTPLPHVTSWESALGSFNPAQPGWARDPNSTSRIPFWFKSSAMPTFTQDSPDWMLGDVLVHTRDDANGVGTGAANVAWTSPIAGSVDVSGGIWMGRDIGRANDWSLRLNGVVRTAGSISSGDPYSRASFMSLASGSGGPSALNDLAVSPGDVLELRIEKTTQYGDFVGVNLTVTAEPAQSTPALSAGGIATLGSALTLGGAVLLRRSLG